MKYSPYNITVPFEKREGYNQKITALIQSGDLQGITHEEVYNLYTGKGRLHGLDRSGFDNYYQYSEAKKEKEQGQFFTPHSLCRQIINCLKPTPEMLIADLTCGTGNFFNCLPNEENMYGNELDNNAYMVCRFLYPKATLNKGDFIYFEPEQKFDLIVGNPPFNLKTSRGISQYVYIEKSHSLLKYAGLLTVIVPSSFLSDELLDKQKIEWINSSYNFIAQALLPPDSFEASIETKLLMLQKKGVTNSDRPYSPLQFIPFEQETIYNDFIAPLHEQNKIDAPKLHLLSVQNNISDISLQYEIKKRLWHIKSNPVLKLKYYTKAIAKMEELKSQRKPDHVDDKEWQQIKLTPEKILRYCKNILKHQNDEPPRKVLKIVKTNYGLKNKAYHKSLQAEAWEKSAHDLLLNGERFKPFAKLYDRKQKRLDIQNRPYVDMKRDEQIDGFLNEFTLEPKVWEELTLFPPDDLPVIKLNDMQKQDLGLLFQKQYGLLAWEQGGGKSVAGMTWIRFLEGKYRNCFIVAPSLAIYGTWAERLKLYGFDFILVEHITDVSKIRPAQIALVSYDRVVILQRFIRKFVRCAAYKIALLVDESDELTNSKSQRSKATLNCFRRVKYKLLTTGTTTRNNINELYTQLELLYNNSTAFTSWAEWIYRTDKDNVIQTVKNDKAGYPFNAYNGPALFKASFCPQKSTVFGIRRETQDVYNAGLLKEIISKTIITRKFEEIVGEKKYSIHTHPIIQTPSEKSLYEILLQEFMKVCYDYYTSTGNARKEAALRLIRQIKALIKATSVPHLMANYTGDALPNKMNAIAAMVNDWKGERVTIGTIFKSTARAYYDYLLRKFPSRKLFYIDGEDSIPKRKKILEAFKQASTGILVCTQQSLKSSVNIPYCNKCIIESLQWNIPKISQFYFRFIRFDSVNHTQVHFINYENTIELNLLALLMAKEKLNDFIKTTNETTTEAVYKEFGIDLNILDGLIQKSYDGDGKLVLSWGKQQLY